MELKQGEDGAQILCDSEQWEEKRKDIRNCILFTYLACGLHWDWMSLFKRRAGREKQQQNKSTGVHWELPLKALLAFHHCLLWTEECDTESVAKFHRLGPTRPPLLSGREVMSNKGTSTQMPRSTGKLMRSWSEIPEPDSQLRLFTG